MDGKSKDNGPCWEPETIPGLAKRLKISPDQIRMWKSRTDQPDASVPKNWPKPSYTDSSGRDLYDGVTMDEWWSDHPSNPAAVTAKAGAASE